MSTLVPRRATAAVLALGAALLTGGLAPAGAASATPPVAGQVRFTGATVTTACDADGDLTSRTVTASYDATGLTAPLSVTVTRAVYDPVSGFTTYDVSGGTTRTVSAGRQDQVSAPLTLTRPQAPSAAVDVFTFSLDDPQNWSGRTVYRVSAVRRCAPVTARTGPSVTVSAPRCDGSLDVTVDATGVTGDWTPTVRIGTQTLTEPVVHPGDVVTRTVDMENLRATRLDVTLSSPSGVPDLPDVAHGVTSGPTVPTCTASTRGAVVPVTPTRVLDTRTGTGAAKGAVPAGGRVVVSPGTAVPAGATAVTLNLTVTEPRREGYLQAWSSVSGPGASSVLNFVAGQTVSRAVVVPLDPSGRFALGNSSAGPAQLVADVTGYAVGDGAPAAGDLVALEATRLLDTRTAGTRVPVAPGATVHVPVVGKAGIGSASAVALQVTAVGGTSAGYLTTWSGTGTRPATSSVNYLRGQVVGALAPTAVAADGTVAVTNTSSGTVHLVVDIEGWWRSGSDVTTGGLRTVAPQRLLDTRVTGGALAPGTSRDVDVVHGVSPSHLHGVSAVLVNLTATSPTAAGYLRAQPQGTPAGTSSALNFPAGATVANQALVGVSDDGLVTITNGSSGSTQVLVDLVAYITR